MAFVCEVLSNVILNNAFPWKIKKRPRVRPRCIFAATRPKAIRLDHLLIPTLCNGVSEFGVSDSPCNTSTKNECGVNLHYVKVGLSRRVCCFYRYCMSRKTRQNSWFVFYLTQLKKVSSVCLPIIKKTRVRVVKENIQRVICSHCKVL